MNTISSYRLFVERYPDTLYAKLAEEQIRKLEGIVTPPAPSPEEVEASLGLTPAEQRQIQMGLASLGFDTGPADGVFGRGTWGAIGRWQTSLGGAATGHLDAEAAKTLLAAGKEAARKQAAMRPIKVFRDCPKCPEMVVVPAGSFMMGSPSSEADRFYLEDPQHRVTIAAPFAVGKYEVSFAEWDACVAAGGCNGYRPDDEGWGRGQRPAINVSWKDAKAYVAWLSRKTGERYRLLSEAEWEYVARAGTTGPFHFGSTISTDQANYNGYLIYGAGREGVFREKTVPVGLFPANGFWLHDVHGNVWEWVEDCLHDSYASAPTDGSAWVTVGQCAKRVLRGGSWLVPPRVLRSAYRTWDSSGVRDYSSGFRIARTLTS